MSNSAYLCCSNSSGLYPSSTDPGYDSKKQTVAMDVEAIPLFWLALFRVEDLVTQTIPDADGNPLIITAPICPVDRALANLDAAIAPLQAAFPDQPHLAGYVPYLKQAIESTGLPWVTAEIIEIESCDNPVIFGPVLAGCLKGFNDPLVTVQIQKPQGFFSSLFKKPDFLSFDWRQMLLRMTDLKPDHPFPEAALFENGRAFEDHESWNHCRLLGDSLYRPVPWIPKAGSSN